MKVLQINTVYPSGSTGKIAYEINNLCINSGIESRVAYRYLERNKNFKNTYTVSSWLDCHLHNRIASYTALQGCFSYFHTYFFLKKISNYKPDIIHLHNLHGNYINLKLLFKYIKKKGIKVIWTLHDCWSFTGNCPYYDMIDCEKWKTGCKKCPQCKSKLFLNNISHMYNNKKLWFTGVADMILVANSYWTAEQAKQSFLKEYTVDVIYNGIDLNIFKPTDSDFRKRYSCENKKIVLGVAFGWGKRKGLDVFIELAGRLDSKKYQIVLVGTNNNVDDILPESIISIHRTASQSKLAEIYTVADVFVNPTREEAFGLVNIEALACGTPGITFDTGGSPECFDEGCGCVVAKDDINSMEKEIIRICETRPYSIEACIERASHFDKNEKFKEYIKLYEVLNEQ